MRKSFQNITIFLTVLIISLISFIGCNITVKVEDGKWDESGKCTLEGNECFRTTVTVN